MRGSVEPPSPGHPGTTDATTRSRSPTTCRSKVLDAVIGPYLPGTKYEKMIALVGRSGRDRSSATNIGIPIELRSLGAGPAPGGHRADQAMRSGSTAAATPRLGSRIGPASRASSLRAPRGPAAPATSVWDTVVHHRASWRSGVLRLPDGQRGPPLCGHRGLPRPQLRQEEAGPHRARSGRSSSPGARPPGTARELGAQVLRHHRAVRRLRLRQVARLRLRLHRLPDRLPQGALRGRVPRRRCSPA